MWTQVQIPEGDTWARNLYIVLSVYHVLMAVERYLSYFVTNFFRDKEPWIAFIPAFVVIYLCQNHTYSSDYDVSTASPKAQDFQMWLWIEVFIFFSTILNGVIYTFSASVSPPVLRFTSPLLDESGTN